MKRTLTMLVVLISALAFAQEPSFRGSAVKIDGATWDKPMYFKNQTVTITNVTALASVYFSNCTGSITGSRFTSANSICAKFTACNDFLLKDSAFVGSVKADGCLVDFSPGHPWSITEYAQARGIVQKGEYAGGTNVNGATASYAEGNSGANKITLLNQSTFTISLVGTTRMDVWTFPAPNQVFTVFKDGQEPIYCTLIAYSGTSITLKAPMALTGEYRWFGFNPDNWNRNIRIEGCSFRDSGGGLLSLYNVSGYVVKDNFGINGLKDGFTYEMTRHGIIEGNRVYDCAKASWLPNGVFYGETVMHGLIDDVRFTNNVGRFFVRSHGQPCSRFVTDRAPEGDPVTSKPPESK